MIELTRAITIGQFVAGKSVLHRLDPRVKLVGMLAIIVLVSLAWSLSAFLVCTVLALFLLALSRLSLRFVLGSLRPAVIFLLFVYVFQVLFYQSAAQHTSMLWQWQFLHISVEGLVASAKVSYRALLLYYFVNLLTFTTPLMDLADGSEALLRPLQRIGVPVTELVLVLVIALKFVPLFIAELERLMKAQAARGVKLDSGSFLSRALKVGPLLVPLVLSGLKRAETLTIAMEARCYRGGRGRTRRRVLALSGRDVIALTFLVVVAAGMIAANLRGPV